MSENNNNSKTSIGENKNGESLKKKEPKLKLKNNSVIQQQSIKNIIPIISTSDIHISSKNNGEASNQKTEDNSTNNNFLQMNQVNSKKDNEKKDKINIKNKTNENILGQKNGAPNINDNNQQKLLQNIG